MSVHPGGGKLEVVFLGYTNTAPRPAHAVLRMKNRGEESLYVMRGVTLEFLPEGTHTCWHEIEDSNFWLAPHASRVFFIPAPTNELVWRAEASFVGQRQIDKKTHLNQKVRHWYWVRKRMASYLQLIPGHARTRWLAPRPKNWGSISVTSEASPSTRYEHGPFGEVVRMTGTMAKANPFLKASPSRAPSDSSLCATRPVVRNCGE